MPDSLSRRTFLIRASSAAGALALGPALAGCDTSTAPDRVARSASAGPAFDAPLDRFIRRKMRGAHIPSIAAATVDKARITGADGFGLADRAADLPADADTVYMLASISKTFVCAALMQLWEAGSVDLDADVNSYLPFPVENPKFPKRKITPRMLLTHTSSVRDRFSVWGSFKNPKLSGYVAGDATIALGTWLADYLEPSGDYYVADENFYPTNPGETFRYSNIGADLAGYLVESVSGQSFSDFCGQHLFQPLGMSQTGWHLSDITTSNLAVPYRYDSARDSYQAYPQYGYPDYPSGSLRTSTNALSIWLRCFMNGGSFEGSRILQSSTVEEIFRPQIPGNWRQGLAWYYERRHGDLLLGHGGSDFGVHTDMFFAPERGVGIIALSNRNFYGNDAWAAGREINARLFAAT